jgi:hypothetical protein
MAKLLKRAHGIVRQRDVVLEEGLLGVGRECRWGRGERERGGDQRERQQRSTS